jgi:hypothetical protein
VTPSHIGDLNLLFGETFSLNPNNKEGKIQGQPMKTAVIKPPKLD